MGFVFSLERVLQLRRQRERQQMLRLAEARRRERDTENRLQALNHRREGIEIELRRFQQTSPRPDMLLAYSRHLTALGERIDATERELVSRRQEVAEERQILSSLAKDRKVLERLRERRLSEYQQEQLYQEQKELDEIAGKMYWQQEGGG